MKDARFWVVLVVAVLFGVFIWPTPFEYKTQTYHSDLRGLTQSKVVKVNRFTGKVYR